MTDYPMLFENIVLSAWGKTERREDPLKMGDAGTLGLVDDKLSGIYGHAKICIIGRPQKIAVENKGTATTAILLDLDNKLWNTKNYSEICHILDKAKTIFESIGMFII